MDKREHKLLQIASVAESEPFGGLLFSVHVGVLLFAALAAYVLFGSVTIAAVTVAYCGIFTIEKRVAGLAYRSSDVSKYPLVLALLLLRALAYNVMVFAVWRTEGDVFKLVALALLVAATINIMVFHATYRALMICVVVPVWLGFGALALQVGLAEGWSPEAIGAAFTVLGVSPYFLLSLHNAHTRWQHQQATQAALNQSQRIDGMGKVAGGVSHDFNNILSVVSGSLQMLERETDETERKRLMDVAHRAIDNGAGLNKQLLALGKRSTLLPQATDLHRALVEFKAFAQSVLPENITFSIAPSAVKPTAFVDAQMLQTALLNLALNAKLAMPGGGRITISCGVASARDAADAGLRGAGRYATVSLRDTGIGMDAETLARVFEPFYTTREVGGGSGLGLPMVKGFAEQSKGGVALSSAPGKGTTVTLFLPLSEAGILDAQAAGPQAEKAAGLDRDARILIVEDNVPLLKLIELRLRKDGLNVVACEDGDTAGQVLDAGNDFDLVLSDFVMPGLIQGPDLVQRVRSSKRRIPFILMSGYADTEKHSSKTAMEQVDLVLEKPLNLERLSREITKLVSVSRNADCRADL